MALDAGQVAAITRKYFLPKLADNIFLGNPALRRFKEKCYKKISGGTEIVLPLEYADASAGWYSGAETLDASDQEVFQGAVLQWKQHFAAITITGLDRAKNNGPEQVIDFVKAKVKNAEKTLKQNLSTGIYSDGTTDPKSIVGLRAWVATSGSPGGISMSANSWWQSQVDGTTTTLTIPAMQTVFANCSEDDEEPSVILGTKANYNRYYALLQPQQRFVDEQSAKAGFTSLMFNGVPFLKDSSVPSGNIFFINEEYIHLCVHKDKDMKMDDFQRPRNQDVESAMIFWYGNLGSNNNRYHGRMSAITA